MKRLTKISLVQFFLYEAKDLTIEGNTAFVGHNGSGKSTLLDAVQIAMMGVHGNYLAFNAQSLGGGRKRSVKDYCLGVTQRDGNDGPTVHARDRALSYITLVFKDEVTGTPVSFGVCIGAAVDQPKHEVEGWFICAGAELSTADQLEAVEDEHLPLSWMGFDQQMRRRAEVEGFTYETATAPENFVRKYLHHLQDRHQQIDVHKYMRALRESLQLKYTDDIDGFVRNHLIAADPIDIQKCGEQIRHFEDLRRLVEDIERKLSELLALQGRINGVREAAERAASASSAKIQFEVQGNTETADAGENKLRELDESSRRYGADMEAVREESALANEQYRRICAQIAQDPAATKRADIEERLTDARAVLQKTQAHVVERLMTASRVLRGFPMILPLVASDPYRVVCERVQAAIDDSSLTGVDIEDLFELLLPLLEKGYDEAEALAREFTDRAREDDAKLIALRGRLRNVESGGSDLRYAGALIEILASNGITARPICDLVRIKDPKWQPAIEGFLGRNRESLLVDSGTEERAIRLIRSGSARRAAYDVAIIQPAHLERGGGATEPDSVASLVEGNEETAVQYVRFLIGRMRCVETEAELRTNGRALSVDGMLSANGGTRPLRLPASHELMIGVRRDGALATKIRREVEDIERRMLSASNDRDRLRGLQKQLAPIAHEAFVKDVVANAEERDRCIASLEHLEETRTALVSGKSADLFKIEEQAKRKVERLQERMNELHHELGVLQAQRESSTKQVLTFRKLVDEQQELLVAAVAHANHRQDLFERICEEVERAFATTNERLRECEERQNRATRDESQRAQAFIAEFRRYADRNNEQLGEEYHEWRSAEVWVTNAVAHLRDLELVQYKAQAEDAKTEAEKSFRRDVAIRLRDKIAKMRSDLRALDNVLRKCPTFSNRENYRFEARPVEALKEVLSFILTFDEETNAPHLFETTDLGDVIARLIEESAQEGSTYDISDYRMFFRFDLLIEQDGKTVGHLSSRMGAGSGGEHRTPLFVIAGAALAAAYRIDVARTNDTLGLMLIDEAFSGLDPQNALAVAHFLSDIGLQLLMAGPDGDATKFAPFCNRMYDMARFDDQIYMDETNLTDRGRELLLSDMPSRHPELVEAEIERLMLIRS